MIDDSEESRKAEQKLKDDMAVSDALDDMHKDSWRKRIRKETEDLSAWAQEKERLIGCNHD